jgi:hypothetical protein
MRGGIGSERPAKELLSNALAEASHERTEVRRLTRSRDLLRVLQIPHRSGAAA